LCHGQARDRNPEPLPVPISPDENGNEYGISHAHTFSNRVANCSRGPESSDVDTIRSYGHWHACIVAHQFTRNSI
jgi:hypothetical protein